MMEMLVTTGVIRRAKLKTNCHHLQTNTQFFLQAGCPSCCQTNSVKALKVNWSGCIILPNTESQFTELPSEGTFGTAVIGLVYKVSVAMHLYLLAAGCSEVCINIQCDIYPEAPL